MNIEMGPSTIPTLCDLADWRIRLQNAARENHNKAIEAMYRKDYDTALKYSAMLGKLNEVEHSIYVGALNMGFDLDSGQEICKKVGANAKPIMFNDEMIQAVLDGRKTH